MKPTDVFRTRIVPQKAPFSIDYKMQGLFLGSCFTEHIGGAMQTHKFPVQVNPFGVLYNPASIVRVIERLMENRPFDASELFSYQDRYLSFLHDTSYSASSPEVALKRINSTYIDAVASLKNASFVFFSLGTARVYEHLATKQLVANCHKIPAMEFQRRLLSLDEIVSDWQGVLSDLWQHNPKLQVIFTVSPVRHWKDGAVGNQHSKALLHCAIHQLVEQDKRLHYFPSYEIMMDDLRDYRFYAEDMLHPSSQAINYIWEFFQQTYFREPTVQKLKRVEKIVKAFNHRILADDKAAIASFAQKQLEEIEQLSDELHKDNFEKEKAHFIKLIEMAGD